MSRRAIISLGDDRIDQINRIAKSRGLSRSAVIREAVDRVISESAPDQDERARRDAAIDAAFGLWQDRTDIGDAVKWQRRERAGWTRPWDHDYDDVRAEFPDLSSPGEDRARILEGAGHSVAPRAGRMTDCSFDSTIIIDSLDGNEAARAAIKQAGPSWISRLTWIKVMLKGDEPALRAVEAFLAVFRIDEVYDAICRRAAMVRRERTRLKLPDSVILASAQVHGRVLVTRNTKDFPATMPGVRIPYTL